jgi:tetratricopeptide (TPR) repeat protein
MRSEDLDDLLEDIERWRMEGEALLTHGEPARALIVLNRALRQHPPRPLASQLFMLKSRALEQLGHPEQALEAADHAVQAVGESAAALARRAAVYSTLGQQAESAADYAAAVQLEPANASYWLLWGSRLNTLSRATEAVSAVERSLALDPTSRAAWTQKGIALHHLARYDEALAAYEEALRLAGEDAPARAQLLLNIAIAHREAGRHGEQLEAAQAAAQIDPTLAGAYLEQGDALFALGRLAEMVDPYQQSVRLDPGNANAWLQLSTALDLLDRPAEAADAYARTLALDPAHPDAHAWRGRALARAWLAAPAHTEEERIAIDSDPDAQKAQTWLDEARVYASRGEWEAAVGGAEEALRLAPDNTEALAVKVRILLRRRQFRAALTAYRQRLVYDRQVNHERWAARRRATTDDGN